MTIPRKPQRRRVNSRRQARAVHCPSLPRPAPDNDEALIPTGRDILSLTEPVDSGDRKLGELLTDLQFIDQATLSALLVEARRQRRSLRQVLLGERCRDPLSVGAHRSRQCRWANARAVARRRSAPRGPT